MAGIDDREVIGSVKGFTFKTFGQLINGIGFIFGRIDENRKWKKQNKVAKIKGETTYLKMVQSNHNLSSQLLDKKVSPDQLREYMNERELPFAIKELRNGDYEFVTLSKNKELVQAALKDMISEIAKHPNKFANEVVSRPKKAKFKTIEDIIKAAKRKQTQYSKTASKAKARSQNKDKVANKAPSRGR